MVSKPPRFLGQPLAGLVAEKESGKEKQKKKRLPARERGFLSVVENNASIHEPSYVA